MYICLWLYTNTDGRRTVEVKVLAPFINGPKSWPNCRCGFYCDTVLY